MIKLMNLKKSYMYGFGLVMIDGLKGRRNKQRVKERDGGVGFFYFVLCECVYVCVRE